jgi:hypothetical protein
MDQVKGVGVFVSWPSWVEIFGGFSIMCLHLRKLELKELVLSNCQYYQQILHQQLKGELRIVNLSDKPRINLTKSQLRCLASCGA